MKNDPLLRNLYHSVGIEIYYEIMYSSGDKWYFENLAKMLYQHGYGVISGIMPKKKQAIKLPPRYDPYTNSYITQAEQ